MISLNRKELAMDIFRKRMFFIKFQEVFHFIIVILTIFFYVEPEYQIKRSESMHKAAKEHTEKLMKN